MAFIFYLLQEIAQAKVQQEAEIKMILDEQVKSSFLIIEASDFDQTTL